MSRFLNKEEAQPSQLGDLKFECIIKRAFKYDATVPTYAVEDGTYISDSILKSPMSMTLETMITNHPLTWAKQIAGSDNRVNEVRDKLLEMYYSGELFTLTTPDNVYENMAITSISFPEDSYLDAIDVSISLQQVITTKADIALAESYDYSGDSEDSVGTTDTSTTSSSSILGSLFSFITGLFGG